MGRLLVVPAPLIQRQKLMKKLIAYTSVYFLMQLLAGCWSEQLEKSVVEYVDPFIGTAGARNITDAANTTPGALLPFGMLNFGPEVAFSADLSEHRRYKMSKKEGYRVPVSPGGYNYAASRIKGFSLTRLSGTGCLGASGDIPILPFTRPIIETPARDTLDQYYSVGFDHSKESASPGFYGVQLDNGVQVALTATDRTGMATFDYPKGQPAQVLFRTSYSQLGSGTAQTKIDVNKGEVTGMVKSGNFCGYLGAYNRRDYYTLYFVARFENQIVNTGSWENDTLVKGGRVAEGNMPYGDNGIPKVGKGSGVWIELDTQTNSKVRMRVGISYVSLDNAILNLDTEQANNPSLETIKKRARDQWEISLGKVQVEQGTKKDLTTFYTALYHAQMHPNVFSDVNGQYTGFDQQTHTINGNQREQYANFSGWDVYRSQLQLLALLHPERASDIAQSLFNQSEQYNGVWDRWTHNSGPTGVMTGDPSSIAIANFVAFGAKDFDTKGAYASLRKAAEVPTHLDSSNIGCPIFCRGQKPSLDQWLSKGYISDSSNTWEGASETLEQAASYFALAQLASYMQDPQRSQVFLKQSTNWTNLYNPKATAEEGYIQGKKFNGEWKEGFDPASEWLFVEGSPRQYFWMVPHDGHRLVAIVGGKQKASKRLDKFFRKEDGDWALYRAGGAYADVSNQPSINAPWMYLFTDKPYKTPETVRATMQLLWNDSTTGIPGQDDLGQMSSWYVFSAMGMYPLVPGKADMALSSPLFANIKIKREKGDINIVSEMESDSSWYINKVRLNGQPYKKSWLPGTVMRDGGTINFELNNQPNLEWGVLEKNQFPNFTNNQ